jgi:hypothetical protein
VEGVYVCHGISFPDDDDEAGSDRREVRMRHRHARVITQSKYERPRVATEALSN